MSNQTIILNSKEGDMELLKELRDALVAKGFGDDTRWNEMVSDWDKLGCVILWADDVVGLHMDEKGVAYNEIIPVSRNDFQTMFLLY